MEGGNVEHKEGEIVAVYVKKEDIVESMDYDWSDWSEIHISPMRPTRGPWGSRRKSEYGSSRRLGNTERSGASVRGEVG